MQDIIKQMIKRRHFFIGSTLIALNPFPRTIHAVQAEKWKMKLSTSNIHFKSLPIEQVCACISKMGFEAIDIWSAHAKCPHLDDVQKRIGPDGLKKILKKNRLRLNSFSVYQGGYKKYAELLGKAGGGIAIQGSTKKCAPNELSNAMKKFINSLKPLVELAEENNSFLAIENHGHKLLHTLDSFKAFTDINTSKHLGIALAPYHLQAAKASVVDAISTCREQLFFFYAWQKGKGMDQLPGQGPIDWKPWLKTLSDIAYKHYVNPFMHKGPEPDIMEQGLMKSRQYLMECYEKI